MKTGDLVKLRSGGPAMTVVALREWEGWTQSEVVWFNKNDEVQTGQFPTALLVVVDSTA